MHLFSLRGKEREKAWFLSAGTAKLTRLRLRVASYFHFSQMLPCSGGRRRDESSGHPFCIALSELQLFSWRAFVFPLRHRRSHMHQSGVLFLSDSCWCCPNPPGRRLLGSLCLFAVPLLRCRGILADLRWFSVQRFSFCFFLAFFLQCARCVRTAGETH